MRRAKGGSAVLPSGDDAGMFGRRRGCCIRLRDRARSLPRVCRNAKQTGRLIRRPCFPRTLVALDQFTGTSSLHAQRFFHDLIEGVLSSHPSTFFLAFGDREVVALAHELRKLFFERFLAALCFSISALRAAGCGFCSASGSSASRTLSSITRPEAVSANEIAVGGNRAASGLVLINRHVGRGRTRCGREGILKPLRDPSSGSAARKAARYGSA